MATWIFLRGLTRESRHWDGFVDRFQLAMPMSQVIALDLPGNGLLNHQPSPLCVQDMVAHCRAQLVARKIQPPYSVLAMSLGAMVAQAWEQSHPAELTSKVLINTSMRAFNPFYQRLRPANYVTLLRLAFLGASAETWERTVLHLTTRQTSDEVLPLWLFLRQVSPVSKPNAIRQLIAAARFRASTAHPSVPTLLLASQQDQLVSVECSKAIAKSWQCPLKLHPTAGHDLPLDDAEWVIRQVQRFHQNDINMP
jgi:pimeloyl-ACP methyl ester carboxylesterase